MFEPLNRPLETFITKLSKSTERRERSRRTRKKPNSYKDESDGCIDTTFVLILSTSKVTNVSRVKTKSSGNSDV